MKTPIYISFLSNPGTLDSVKHLKDKQLSVCTSSLHLKSGTESSVFLIRSRSTTPFCCWSGPYIPASLITEVRGFPLQGGGSQLASHTDHSSNPTPFEETFAEPSWTPWAAVAPPLAPLGSDVSEYSPTVSECAIWTGRQQLRLPVPHWKTTVVTGELPEAEEWQATPEATQPPPSSQPWSAYRKHFTLFRFVPPSSGSALRAGLSGSWKRRGACLLCGVAASLSDSRLCAVRLWTYCAGVIRLEPGQLG